MKQLEFDDYERCQQRQKLLAESKQFRQQSQQIKSTAKVQCQNSKRLRDKSNKVLQKSLQLQSRLEKQLKLKDRLYCVPDEFTETIEQLSMDDLDRRFEWVNELQSDVDRRLQAAKKLQFNIGRCFEKVSHLLEKPNLNFSASKVSQAPDLTDSKNVLEEIDYLIEKLKIGDW